MESVIRVGGVTPLRTLGPCGPRSSWGAGAGSDSGSTASCFTTTAGGTRGQVSAWWAAGAARLGLKGCAGPAGCLLSWQLEKLFSCFTGVLRGAGPVLREVGLGAGPGC